jgi:hypothetical protein
VSASHVAEGKRVSDRLPGESEIMKDRDVAEEGYPEEQPPGADPGGGERSQESPAREDAERAPDHDDDTATGNPNVDR